VTGRHLLICAIAFAFVACGGSAKPELRGTELTSGPAAPNFTLVDQDGHTVSMAAQRGRWVVVTFLYTQCPDVCPLIAAQLNRVLEARIGRQVGLRVLAVSVDPARDTPKAVRRYVLRHRLGPRFRWLIGSRNQLARVWKAYHVAALPGPRGTVTHSTVSFLVDPSGRERLLYDKSVKAGFVLDDLRALNSD
jgi:protein SCO1